MPGVGQKDLPSHASGTPRATWGTTAKATPTARALSAALLAEGLHRGTPSHLTARAESIGRQLCRALGCPACRRRGLSDRPFSDGRRYVALATCPCGRPAVVSTGECLRCCDAAADRQARRYDLDALDDL
jgi:hypothetical protein